MRILRNVLVDDNYLKTGGGRESNGGGIGSSPKTVGVLKKSVYKQTLYLMLNWEKLRFRWIIREENILTKDALCKKLMNSIKFSSF